MARVASIEKSKRYKKLYDKYYMIRYDLKKKLMNKELSNEERLLTARLLAELPNNSSITSQRKRCNITGRSRGYRRRFGLCGIKLREIIAFGLLPGVHGASW